MADDNFAASETGAESIPAGTIEERDSLTPSPNERTLKVWEFLSPYLRSGELTNWDVICFCAGYLAKQCNVYDVFKNSVIELGRYVINLHYLFPELTTDLDKEKNGLLE